MPVALITGITGQDGSYLAERLVSQGYEVHGIAHEVPGPGQASFLPAEAGLHVVDLRDSAAVAELTLRVAPQEVYNLGGISSVAYSWDHPVETGAVSGLGAINVYEAAWQLQERTGVPVRLVQASSAEIFGTPDRTPQDEETTVRPLSPYGAAKAYAHLSAGVYRARGLGVSSVVLYNHESPRRPTTFVTRKITAAAARIAREGGTLSLGNLDARRDWGWAPDYVDAMVRAVRHSEADDFVVATGVTHTVAEFVETAFTHAGIERWRDHVEVDPRFFRPAEAATQVGDPSRALRVLGWSPTTAFPDMVRRMVDHDITLLDGAV